MKKIVVNDKKKAVAILGYMWSLGISFCLTLTFYTAYMNPSKTVLVLIDHYHEAIPEAIMLPIVWLVMILGFYYMIQKLKE